MAKWWVSEKPLNKVDPSQVPLGVILDRYYSEYVRKKKSKTQAKTAIAIWKDYFKGATCADVTEGKLEDFVGYLKEVEWTRTIRDGGVKRDVTKRGYSRNYILRTLSVGRSALLRAERRNELARAPKIRVSKAQRVKKYRMKLHEAAALFNAATTDHFRMYLLLAFATAQRPINILELTTDRIDLESRLIDFEPSGHAENNKGRPVVAICDTLMPALGKLRPGFAIRWKKNQDKPIGGIKTAFNAARERAGLRKEITPYTIRRTMATELRKRGVGVDEIAGLLGHKLKDLEITEMYAEYAPDFMSKVTKAIDDYFRELSPLLKEPLVLVDLDEQPGPGSISFDTVPLLARLFASESRGGAGPDGGKCTAENDQRAKHTPVTEPQITQDIDFMVGVTGFEPATYTSRT